MGCGIAVALAKVGLRPTIIEIIKNLDDVKREIATILGKENIESEYVEVVGVLEEVRRCNLLIEAIAEDLKTKEILLKKIGELIPKQAIIVTNTSSLSVTELGKASGRPDKFIGMHFFNPAYLIDFIEIVPGDLTSNETVEEIKLFADCMKKKYVVVKDSPGFIVNRLLFLMINEAAELFMDRVAGAREIDKSMRLGAKHPIGPLALADLIGIDICLAILESLNKRIPGGRYKPSTVFYDMIRSGYLGRKNKRGFYDINLEELVRQ